jgi:glycerol-1-phosphate dehydrogenase [NAD(P)+]
MKAQIYSFDHVYDCLKKVGAPYEPEMIGLTRAKLMDTFSGIPYMRSRYTVVDLIKRCGLMDQVTAALFGPGGHWAVSE